MKTISISNKTIIISETVLNVIQQYIQNTPQKKEAGGILLGQVIQDKIYITRASTPNKFDKSSRYLFERNKEIAQVIVDYEFANSNSKTIYIGEWHTHPENTPTPSNQDKKMIKEQFRLSKLNEPFLVLIIQGIKELYLGLYNKDSLNGAIV